jgi:putative transposase
LLKTNPKEIDLLRKHFRTGRPLGDEKFLLEAEKITGRELIPKKPGPKPKKR